MDKLKASILLSILFITWAGCSPETNQTINNKLQVQEPEHGYLSQLMATKWEESMLSGNGKTGALVLGDPLSERVVLSHERLFMPQYPPMTAPDLASKLPEARRRILSGDFEGAAGLLTEAGEAVGIESLIWTDPLVPACQIEIETVQPKKVLDYNKAVNYENGETVTTWRTEDGSFQRKLFVSRPDDLVSMKINAETPKSIQLKVRLAQLPFDDEKEEMFEELEEDEDEDGFVYEDLIKEVSASADESGWLSYKTVFQKSWDGSLKGYVVESKFTARDGQLASDGDWLYIKNASEVSAVAKIKLSFELPVSESSGLDVNEIEYDALLQKHEVIHSEMFNRFSLKINPGKKTLNHDALYKASSDKELNAQLVEQLCESARYIIISSAGDLPPTLQGIWGGTWLPAWSGDFTLNGNVPSAIASGLNTNFQEVMESYMGYMNSMISDFEGNAKNLYGAPGIMVPSRSSSFGSAYHYSEEFPHLFWFAGNAWTSQFYYDYWQYTRNEEVLKDEIIPFMLASVDFYEHILTKDDEGGYMFIPSYSPEIGPIGKHPVAINATMDIAGLKQLIRNLLSLVDQGFIDDKKKETWTEILENLPKYAIDANGELKEWIWPGYENDNSHRHASHLYPLFYELDPEIEKSSELIAASKAAIESRMKYRRDKNGAEMAFGLVQKGLAAAHIGDTEHAFECVNWLSRSYWSPAYTAYHDPGQIFNVDICGGLPSLVTEMVIQSSADEIALLPALPDQWSDGVINGVLTRTGSTIDLVWKGNQPVSAKISSPRDSEFKMTFKDQEWNIKLSAGQVFNWSNN